MVHCGENTTLPRPFSIHHTKGNNIALLFYSWEDGEGTDWLARRRAGDSIEVLGPLGNAFNVLPGSRRLLLIAGGIGIAPLYYLSQML